MRDPSQDLEFGVVMACADIRHFSKLIADADTHDLIRAAALREIKAAYRRLGATIDTYREATNEHDPTHAREARKGPDQAEAPGS